MGGAEDRTPRPLLSHLRYCPGGTIHNWEPGQSSCQGSDPSLEYWPAPLPTECALGVWGRGNKRKFWVGQNGAKRRYGSVPLQPPQPDEGPGQGRSRSRHDATGRAGGRDAYDPVRKAGSPWPLTPPLPRRGPLPQPTPILTLCPPAPAPSTCSTSCPTQAGLPPPFPASHGPQNTSVPGQVQAGIAAVTRRLELPLELPCYSHSAAGDTSRRGGRGAAWTGSARLSIPAREARRDL